MPNKKTNQHQPGCITNWIVTTSLLKVCVATAALALLILILAWILWGRLAGLSRPELESARATAALTTVGGLGGSVYLIVRYRAQDIAEKQHKTAESDHNEQLMSKALELLASDNPIKQISGARQLVLLANEYDGPAYQQRIIDALCTFLKPSIRDDFESAFIIEEIFLEAMRDHLRQGDEGPCSSWSECSFDFRGVHFNSCVDLSGCQFRGATDWRGARFAEDALFSNANFTAILLFSDVEFSGEARFDGCEFASKFDADFSCSSFKRNAYFTNARFSGTTVFGSIRREEDNPDDVYSIPATFHEEADFSGAVFGGDARFGAVPGGDVHFGLDGKPGKEIPISRFDGPAHFEEAKFEGRAYFGDVCFMQGAFFNSKSGGARRRGSTPVEQRSNVGRPAENGATFKGSVYFSYAHFLTDGEHCLRFDFAEIHGTCFDEQKFVGAGERSGARDAAAPFLVNIEFTEAYFDVPPSFRGAKILCNEHRSCDSRVVWPEGVISEENAEKDIPEGAQCPSCQEQGIYDI